jgi:hypothetical protein
VAHRDGDLMVWWKLWSRRSPLIRRRDADMPHHPNVRANAARLFASGVRMNADYMNYGQTRICPTQKQPGP